MKVFEVKNLYKNFGKKEVLKGISFSVEEGEIVAFVGPNGAGKTTLIKTALGLQKKKSGEVYLNGVSLEENYVEAMKKIGAIIESPDSYLYLTGRENLKLYARVNDVPFNELDKLIKLVGLEKAIDQSVSKYSLGMRQRLGIAQSLINSPSFLILDEPTNGLDPEGIIEFRKLLLNLAHEHNVAILVSSHNLKELEEVSDKVVMIKNGELVYFGKVSDALDEAYTVFEVNKIPDYDDILKIDDNHFEYHIENKTDVNQMIKRLIKDEIEIYSIERKRRTMEEFYLEKGEQDEKSNN